jgi:hypothetical protein
LQSNSNSEKKINVLFLNCLQNNIRTVWRYQRGNQNP